MAVRWKFYPSENIPTNDSFYCFAVLSLDEKLAKGQNHGHKAKLIQTSNFFSNHCRSLLQEKGRQFKQWRPSINFNTPLPQKLWPRCELPQLVHDMK